MTDSFKLGPGTLTLGTDPDDAEFSMQLSNCRVDPSESVTAGARLNLLDGGELKDDDTATYSFVLAGTAVQDLIETGIVAYTWENKGETVAFVFVPVTAREASITGHVRIVPLSVGGDVKVRNTATFSFACTGADPVFVPDEA